jgi:hypothetical protein
LQDSLLVTGFAYDRHERIDNNYAEFCWITHRCRGVRRGGAAAVDLAFVATGRLDGYWERGLAPWDLAQVLRWWPVLVVLLAITKTPHLMLRKEEFSRPHRTPPTAETRVGQGDCF